MSETPQIFRPSEIAERLGVSGSTFRRYMSDFEVVLGRSLARDGHKRILTEQDARTLETAHQLLTGGSVESYRSGIARALGLEESSPTAQPLERQVSALPEAIVKMPEQLGQLLEGVSRLERALEAQNQVIEGQRAEIAALREQLTRALPAPQSEAVQQRSWWSRLFRPKP
jgi:DNA-binding transcriptional MerR regulator